MIISVGELRYFCSFSASGSMIISVAELRNFCSFPHLAPRRQNDAALASTPLPGDLYIVK
jgi:hypothetical protein